MLLVFILWLFTMFVMFSSVVYAFFNDEDDGGVGAKPPLRRFWESSGEYRCRKWLTNRFNVPLPNVRSYWLINPETFRRLELDCYNADLGIAVEYQGRQHYDGSDPSIARRDAYKVQACIDRGVALVVVPYWANPEEYLEHEFARLENSAR